MENKEKNIITVEVIVHAPLPKVWDCWTNPAHITGWCFASDDWHAPKAENDLREGGKFCTRMEAKDGSFGFDFEGTYSSVKEFEAIDYAIVDGRTVSIRFTAEAEGVRVVESFEAETMNPHDMQKSGWQSILNNFKIYTESVLTL